MQSVSRSGMQILFKQNPGICPCMAMYQPFAAKNEQEVTGSQNNTDIESIWIGNVVFKNIKIDEAGN